MREHEVTQLDIRLDSSRSTDTENIQSSVNRLCLTCLEINVCKKKQLTNTRSSSADEALRLTPKKVLSLEQALEFIDTDEYLEVTPTSLRIRKKILDPTMRKRMNR
jgi:predicted membrane GTPase involved in stress response